MFKVKTCGCLRNDEWMNEVMVEMMCDDWGQIFTLSGAFTNFNFPPSCFKTGLHLFKYSFWYLPTCKSGLCLSYILFGIFSVHFLWVLPCIFSVLQSHGISGKSLLQTSMEFDSACACWLACLWRGGGCSNWGISSSGWRIWSKCGRDKRKNVPSLILDCDCMASFLEFRRPDSYFLNNQGCSLCVWRERRDLNVFFHRGVCGFLLKGFTASGCYLWLSVRPQPRTSAGTRAHLYEENHAKAVHKAKSCT